MIVVSMVDGLTISLDGKALGEASALFGMGDVFPLPEAMRLLYFEGLSAEGSKKKQEKLRGLFMFRKASTEEILQALRLGKSSSKFAPALERRDLDKGERVALRKLITEKVEMKISEAEKIEGSPFFDEEK